MYYFKVLLKVSGSIAAFKAAALTSQLVQKSCEVQVVASESALKFVGAATFEGLTGKPVLSDVFTKEHMMDHIHLNKWADLVLLYPATANQINRLAHGLGEDLIGALSLAHNPNTPYWIAPAMNTLMWEHPSVQASLQILRNWGRKILVPQEGRLACGDRGAGRVLEPNEVLSLMEEASSSSRSSILVTAGGTREPLDSVRFLTNFSTGATAAKIAESLARRGYQVTYLHGEGAQLPDIPVNALSFGSFKDFNQKVSTLLSEKNYFAVVQAAALSDFSLPEVPEGLQKLSSAEDLHLHLKKNFKVISRLREYSLNKKICVIGFKLTAGATEKRVQEKVELLNREAQPDLIVHNDLGKIKEGRHEGTLFKSARAWSSFSTKTELASKICDFIEDQENSIHSRDVSPNSEVQL